ncbi:MAG TPA: insulinase family protein [Bacteroidales bacterium]|nr:insulinase family protein [Bacteroidales bacterium]
MKALKISLILLFVSTLSVLAQGLQPAPMDTAIRYGKLSNGLTYYIRHNEQPKQRAEFYIAQNVGAMLEEDSQNGLAHFLEHMCFNGTKNYPGKNFLNGFEKMGVKFGDNINAYTSLDETVYNLSDVPTNRESIIDSSLLILHDWSNFVSLEDAEIDQERGVIREEWRQGRTAARRMMQERNKVIFGGSKYAIRDVIGDTAVINNFKYNDLRSYYKQWYRPDLQAILVVGDINVDQIEAKIKQLFSDIPAPVNPSVRTYYTIPDNDQPIVGVFTDPELTSTQILMFWKKQGLPDEVRKSIQGFGLSQINQLISQMTNERLSNICQEPNSPFSSAGAEVSDLVRTMDAYLFVCSPVMGKEKEARERILKEAEIIRRFGFTESELERAKTELLSFYEKAEKERNQQKNNKLVEELVRNFTVAEPCSGISWENDMVKQILPSINLQIVNQIATSYMPDKNFVFTISGPEKAGLVYPTNDQLLQEIAAAKAAKLEAFKDSVSNDPLIQKMPKPGKVKKEIENKEQGTIEWTLSNRIKVILKPTKFKDDEIKMSAWSYGGLSLVPQSDLISGTLATDVINQSGLGTFNLTDLGKKLSGKIASVSPSIGNYDEALSGSSSVKDQETMLQLAYLYFTATRKDENAYELYMKQVNTYLENAAGNPQKAYADSMSLITYGYNPRIVILNTQTIKNTDLNAIQRIYKERFANPADFTFTFVGNIDVATFKPLVEKYLGGLKTTNKLETWKDNNIRVQKGLIRKDIVKPLKVSKTTNNIRYSAPMPFNMTNVVCMEAIASILDLRYTATIREKEGATYGVGLRGSVLNTPIDLATLVIRFDTDPKLVDKMLGIIHSEIDTLALFGPKPEDLNKVKLNMLKQYKEDVEDNNYWLNALNRYYKDKLNYAADYEKAVQSLSIESIRSTTKELLKPNNRLELLLQPQN